MVDLASCLRIFPLLMGVFVERPLFPHCAKGIRPDVGIAIYVEADSERRWWLHRCTSVYHGWVRPLTPERPQVGSRCALSHVRSSIVDCGLEMRT